MLYKKILSGFVSLSFFVNPYYSYGGHGEKEPEQGFLDHIYINNAHNNAQSDSFTFNEDSLSITQQLINAADSGDLLMQFEVAVNFSRGSLGFPYDINKAIDYLRRASTGKYIPAMFEYASLLENGTIGVEKNYREAITTYLNIISVSLEKDTLKDFAYFIALSCYRLGLIYGNDEHQELGLNLTTSNSTKEAELYYKKGLKALRYANVHDKEFLESDLLYLLGKGKELSNRYFASKIGKHHLLIRDKLITNNRYIYKGLSNDPNSSCEVLDKLQKNIIKSQEKLANNNYIILLKDVKSEFLQQLVWCYSRMNRTSKSFEAQKKIIIDKATVILHNQRDLMKIYDLAPEAHREDHRKKLLQLYENYVINQLVFNRIAQGFTRNYEEHEEEMAVNFEAINKYLDDLSKGNLKSANLKLLRYYGKIDDLEKSSKIVKQVISSSSESSQTNGAKISIANDIDLTNIEGKDLMDLLESVRADKTVTGLILQQKNLSEMIGVLNQVIFGNPNLIRLDLSGNQITVSQLQLLVKSLKQSLSLTELILDNNLLGDDGVSLLLPVIKKNRSLQLLSLINNEISQLGGVMLFGLLAQISKRIDTSFKLILRGNEAQKLFHHAISKDILSAKIIVELDTEVIAEKAQA